MNPSGNAVPVLRLPLLAVAVDSHRFHGDLVETALEDAHRYLGPCRLSTIDLDKELPKVAVGASEWVSPGLARAKGICTVCPGRVGRDSSAVPVPSEPSTSTALSSRRSPPYRVRRIRLRRGTRHAYSGMGTIPLRVIPKPIARAHNAFVLPVHFVLNHEPARANLIEPCSMLSDACRHDCWQFQRLALRICFPKHGNQQIGLGLPALVVRREQPLLSRGHRVFTPESAVHMSPPFSQRLAIRERGWLKSRKPVAKKCNRSALYLSGATWLASSSCRPARVRSFITLVRRRLAMREDARSYYLCFTLFSIAVQGLSSRSDLDAEAVFAIRKRNLLIGGCQSEIDCDE